MVLRFYNAGEKTEGDGAAMDNNEKIELLKDCKECVERIQNLNNQNYRESEEWAMRKCFDWIQKDKENAKSLSVGTILPKTDIEKAYNTLDNCRKTLFNISLKNGMDLER